MTQFSGDRNAEFYAESYDDSVPDWPGEINFYREMAAEVKATGGSVLEIACGAVLAAAFYVDARGVTNQQLQLIAGGPFLIGLGEWKNHRNESWIKPPNVYTGWSECQLGRKCPSPALLKGNLLACFGRVQVWHNYTAKDGK